MDLILPSIFAIIPICGLYYRVIESSILQKKLMSQNAHHAMKKKEYKLDTYDKLCVMRLTKNQKTQ